MVNCEWCWMVIALAKCSAAMAPVMVITFPRVMRDVIGIVECWNNAEQPCGKGENAVPENIGPGYFSPPGKWIVRRHLGNR